MEITSETVKHIASLSSLNLSEDEIKEYANDMSKLVEFASQINEVDTSNTEISAFALDGVNVFRKDIVKESMDRELLLSNAPNSNGVAFNVPKVM